MDLPSKAEEDLVIAALIWTTRRHSERNKGMNSDLRKLSHLTWKGLHYMKVPTFVNL